MLALEEKTRSVALLMPQLVLEGKADELIGKFEEAYLEVKARKEVYLAHEAEMYFHYLEPAARQAAVASAARGLCQVLVLEHLEGDVVERALAMKEATGAGGAPTTNAVVVTGEMGEVEELFEEEEAEKAEVEVDESKSKPISNVVDKAEVLPDMFPLMPECETAVSRSEIPGCDAFVLDNVLTKEECEALIHQAQGLWTFWENDPGRPRISFRNAFTVEVTHPTLAERLWQRVAPWVRPEVQLSEEDPRFEVDIEGSWQPYGVNPKLLLSRYLDGGHFSPHTDGTTVVDFNRRTFYSCVLFLNASAWGGHTRLYADEQMDRELQRDDAGRLTGDPKLIVAEVEPKVGRMLGLEELYGTGSFYMSLDKWECQRDIEFFFPHLDALPVERTLAVIKPDALAQGEKNGKTVDQAAALGLFVVAEQPVRLNGEQAKRSFLRHSREVYQQDGCLAMCFEGRGAIGKMQLVVGPLHSGTARQRAPTTIRALWGTDGTCNGVHASTDMESADQEIKSVFPTGSLKLERTLCIVKPDAINHVVAVKTELEAAGFTILKEKQTSLTEERAREFYRTATKDPAFSAMVKEACSGPCCAMVLYRLEAVTVLKQLMGDASVHVARATRPGSLRARFGRDGQRNALHGSDSLKAAVQDIKFFFPDMGVDPLPDDHEVKDFLFRKSARASMDLQTLSDAQTTDFAVDPTFQQLMSNSLIGLCKVKPQGLDAVKWLANWLAENNPNSQASGVFDPPARSKQYVEYGVNQELKSLVPDEIVLKLLKNAMVKNQDTNRFLLDGFPRSVEQAQQFERDIAEVSFLLYLEASHDTMKQRIQGRAQSNPGRVDDNDETVRKRLEVFDRVVYAECKRFFSCRFLYLLGPPGAPVEQMSQKLEKQYGYAAINLTTLLRSYANSNEPEAPAVRKALAAGKPAAWRQTKMDQMEGRPVDASIACPLILSEIYRDMALGVQNFVLADFPQSLKQAQFLEYRISCITRALVLDFSKADASDLAAKSLGDLGESSSMLETIKAERIPCKLSEMQSGSGAFVDDFGALEGRGQFDVSRKPGASELPTAAWRQQAHRYVDQIELIENEFRIEKVYYISGSEQAETLWAEEYAKKGESGKFLKLQTRLQPIAAHFSRLGKLEKFEVSETPSKDRRLAAGHGAAPSCAPLRVPRPVPRVVSLETLKGTCPEAEGEIAMLKQYTQGTSAPLVVLHNFPSVDSQAHAFEAFGAPRVVLDIECDDEYLEEEWKGLHEEDEFDAEQFAEKLGQQRASMEATSKVFKQMCPGAGRGIVALNSV
eukprot:g25068.t1